MVGRRQGQSRKEPKARWPPALELVSAMPQSLLVPITGLQDGCLCQPAGFNPGRCHHPYFAHEERTGAGSLNSMVGQQVLLVGFRLQVSRWEAQVQKTERVPILTTGLESATSAARRVKRNH